MKFRIHGVLIYLVEIKVISLIDRLSIFLGCILTHAYDYALLIALVALLYLIILSVAIESESEISLIFHMSTKGIFMYGLSII